MARQVTISTACILIPSHTGFPSPCIEHCMSAIEEAGRRGTDLLVLPEEPDVVGCDPERVFTLGEAIPGGPLTAAVQERAAHFRMYIVWNIRERDGDHLYNTAALIGRDGQVIGKYRKTHLAPGEADEGVCPGDDLPVFETDFGKVGVMICMDIHYPEIVTVMALQGAEVVCWPTQALDYTGDLMESLVNARAIDNQVFMVSSHFVQEPFLAGRSMGHARIVDTYGRTRADTSHRPGLATALLDLDDVFEMWYAGDLKRRYPTMKHCLLGMRRPELYGIIAQPDTERAWEPRNPLLYDPP